MDLNKISIYLHWPFCESKCPYCDFNSHVRGEIIQTDWLRGYLNNIHLWLSKFQKPKIDTIFFGGGTPSLIKPKIVSKIIDTFYKNYLVSENVEISLEANPSSVEMKKFKGYADAGINRISIGVQSFIDKDLKLLGRQHNAQEAISAINTGLCIFDNLSFDLIYGRQFQKLKDWEKELKYALSFGSQHLSLYQLTIENNTAFGRLFHKGKLKGLPDDESSKEFFLTTNKLCDSYELKAYEISNFSLDNYNCKHNLNYWKCGNFLGIGPGAHGRYLFNNNRFSYENIKNPENWLEKSSRGELAIDVKTKLTELDYFEEFVIMGLRLNEGLNLMQINEKFNKYFERKKLDYLINLGLIKIDNNQLKILPKGKLLLDSIVKELLT